MKTIQVRFEIDQSNHEQFGKLPRKIREEAYQAIREQIGRNEIVTVEAMLYYLEEKK